MTGDTTSGKLYDRPVPTKLSLSLQTEVKREIHVVHILYRMAQRLKVEPGIWTSQILHREQIWPTSKQHFIYRNELLS